MHCRHEMVSLLFTSPSRLRESLVLCHLSLKQWRRRSRRTRRDVPCEQAGNGRADHCKVYPCAEVNVRAGSLTYSNILTRNPGVLASYIDLTRFQTSFHFSHVKCRFIVIAHYYEAVRQNFTHKLCSLIYKHSDVTISTYFCCLHPNRSSMASMDIVNFPTRALTLRTARAHAVSTYAGLNIHKQISARAQFTQNARPASPCWEPPSRASTEVTELCRQRHKRACTRRR